MEKWHDRLNEAMELLGWGAPDLASASGVDVENIKKYRLGGVDNPRGNTLPRLADALGVSPVWLRHGGEDEAPTLSNAHPIPNDRLQAQRLVDEIVPILDGMRESIANNEMIADSIAGRLLRFFDNGTDQPKPLKKMRTKIR